MSAINPVVVETAVVDEYAPVSEAAVESIVPFCACVCCVSSCYTTFPGCIGCSGRQQCLCCYSDYYGCKIPKRDEDMWCDIMKGHTYFAVVEAIYKVLFNTEHMHFVAITVTNGGVQRHFQTTFHSNALSCSVWTCAALFPWQRTSRAWSPAASSRSAPPHLQLHTLPSFTLAHLACLSQVYLGDSVGPYLFYRTVQELQARQEERTRQVAEAQRSAPTSAVTAPPVPPSSPAANSADTVTATETAGAAADPQMADSHPGAAATTVVDGDGQKGASVRRVPSAVGSEVHPSLRTHTSDADEEEYYP
jgi:hypothetical protein